MTKKTILILAPIVIILAIGLKIFFMYYDIFRSNHVINNTNSKALYFILIKKGNEVNRKDKILYSLNDGKLVLSRCVAFPGEKISIEQGEVLIDNKQIDETYYAQKTYRVNCFTNDATYRLINKYRLIEDSNYLEVYYLDLSLENFKKLKKDSSFFISSQITPKDFRNNNIFPHSFRFNWNEDNFGPLLIPQKNLKININEISYSIYKNLIENYEKIKIEKKDSKDFFINNNKIESYIFENDYYFVLSDLRSHLNDSRTFGPIPKNKIIGRFIACF